MHVQVKFEHFEPLPADRERMDGLLARLAERVGDHPEASLQVTIVRQRRAGDFHVKTTLSVEKARLFTGERHVEFYSAIERCARKLQHKLESHRAQHRRIGERRRSKATRPPVPVEDAALAAAAAAGDFPAFRAALDPGVDELERHVGRAVEAAGPAERQLGLAFTIADVVDEVCLLAFEGWEGRSHEVPVRGWMHGLVGTAIEALVAHPEEEVENIRLAKQLEPEG